MNKKELTQMRLDIDHAASLLRQEMFSTGIAARDKLRRALELLEKWSLDDEKPAVDDL